MVSTTSILFMVFTLALVVLFPLILAIIFYRKSHYTWWAILVGALVFLVSQVLIRIPLITAASQTEWYRSLAASSPALIGLVLAFTAGLFEETGRWLGFRYLLRNRWQTKNGIAFGIGHGGFEALFLVGLTYVNNLVLSLMINSGQFDALVAPQLGGMAEVVKSQLVDTPWYMFAVGGLERFMVIIIHIALSLVVLIGVRSSRPVYLLYAILLHTILNLPAALLAIFPQLGLWVEVYILALAVVAYLFIRRMWQQEKAELQAQAPA